MTDHQEHELSGGVKASDRETPDAPGAARLAAQVSRPGIGKGTDQGTVEGTEQGTGQVRGRAKRNAHHRDMLLLAGVAIIAAFALGVPADQPETLLLFSKYRLPPLCASRSLFGISCPGCGLTRSITLLAHGELRRSLAMHPVGAIMAIYIVAQIPYRIAAMRSVNGLPLGERIPKVAGWALIVTLLGSWLIGQLS